MLDSVYRLDPPFGIVDAIVWWLSAGEVADEVVELKKQTLSSQHREANRNLRFVSSE